MALRVMAFLFQEGLGIERESSRVAKYQSAPSGAGNFELETSNLKLYLTPFVLTARKKVGMSSDTKLQKMEGSAPHESRICPV